MTFEAHEGSRFWKWQAGDVAGVRKRTVLCAVWVVILSVHQPFDTEIQTRPYQRSRRT